MVVQNFNWACTKYIKKFSNCFFYLVVTKFILELLSKNISKIRYSKSCILYHITYITIKALLYQPQRFILTFKSKRSMVSFGGKHCKYDMHIYFYASLLGIAFKSFIDDKDFTAQGVCKNNGLFVCLYKSLASTCFVLLYHFLIMCTAFVFDLKKQDIFLVKNYVDFDFISLIHSYVYIHIELYYPRLLW